MHMTLTTQSGIPFMIFLAGILNYVDSSHNIPVQLELSHACVAAVFTIF